MYDYCWWKKSQTTTWDVLNPVKKWDRLLTSTAPFPVPFNNHYPMRQYVFGSLRLLQSSFPGRFLCWFSPKKCPCTKKHFQDSWVSQWRFVEQTECRFMYGVVLSITWCSWRFTVSETKVILHWRRIQNAWLHGGLCVSTNCTCSCFITGWWFPRLSKSFFIFTPKLGEEIHPFWLTHLFQTGLGEFNHQLDNLFCHFLR